MRHTEEINKKDETSVNKEQEAQKIREFVSENKGFMTAVGYDVANSLIDGKWYCYEYSKEFDYYEFFVEFNTVSELADILIKEMTMKLELAVEREVAIPDFEDRNLATEMHQYYQDTHLKKLEGLLEEVRNIGSDKHTSFFTELERLIKHIG